MSDLRSRNEKDRRHGDAFAEEFAVRFEDALERGDALSAESIATEAFQANLEVEEIYDQVIGPGMIRIGQLWQDGTASVADEHLATAISQQVMASLFPRMLHSTTGERHRVMLAGPEGEHHVLGLRMIADTLEGAGYEVLYLGPNVPKDSLLDACRKHHPTALGLTAAMPSAVPVLVEVVEAVLELEKSPAIFVGGRAMTEVRGWKLIPVAQNCEEVVEFVATLMDNPVLPEDVRGSLESGYTAWQENLTEFSEDEVEAGPNSSKLAMATAFSTNAEVAAAGARVAARDAFRTKELAYRDGLTGLWNRRAYDDRLRELTEEGTQKGAVLMLDVDRFKEVNDSFGHEAGDEALIGVGEAILRSIRQSDFGARYGGDEFVVLMPGMDLDAATEVAERIRSTIKRELRDPSVTVSIGASTLGEDPRASALAIDQALYGAKRTGRDCVVST